MPLTNAEKQRRARDKRADKIARYEAALREIEQVNGGSDWNGTRTIARAALDPAPSRLHSKGE